MKRKFIKWIFEDREKKPPVLLAVTPPRTGERTLLSVENMLGSIAVPEPFSLELAATWTGCPSWPAAWTTRWCGAR